MFDAHMFVAMLPLLAHLVGDYLFQSDWMAQEKVKKSTAALAHAVTYTLPFLFLTRAPLALLFICITHFVIDRWRLAKYVCWAKNWLAPKWIPRDVRIEGVKHIALVYDANNPQELTPGLVKLYRREYLRNYPWAECQMSGYRIGEGEEASLPGAKPAWMAVWLLIITDNTLHLLCNAFALATWG